MASLEIVDTASGGGSLPPKRLFVDDVLRLERFRYGDEQQLSELIAANRNHLNPIVPWVVDDFTPLSRARRSFSRVMNAMYAGKTAPYKINDEDVFSGVINLHSRKSNTAKMGYWLAESAQHKGLVTVAAHNLARVGFEQLGLETIELHIREGNDPSIAVAQRLGATLLGTQEEPEGFGRHRTYEVWELRK